MTYTAGIIGTGGVAGMGLLGTHDESKIGEEPVDASHAGGYARNDDIELVAAADIDTEQLATFGDVWDIPPDRRYEDHQAMLAAEDLDVVSVATPTFLHHEHVCDAAWSSAAPDAIWCEKPIASSVADAEEMVGVCEERGVELVINHTTRFTDNMARVQELIADGLIGDIEAASGVFRMELMRNSTHLIDTLVFLLDARASRVSGYLTGENEAVDALDASTPVDDQGGGGFVVLDDGSFVTIDCTVPRDHSTYQYDLVGSEGKLRINVNDGDWQYWELTEDGHQPADLPGVSPDPDEWADGFAEAVDHLVALVKGSATNRSPGTAAVRSLEIIVGFYISEYTGSHVEIPLADPLKDVTVTSW
ncbi:MAG: Gfo/Idh/MocA family protein [Halobacteriaceae archaeon]